MKIISRNEAIELGLEKYFTGRPCKRGHISERRTLVACCIECEQTKRDYILKKQRERRQREADAALADTAVAA